MQRIVRDTSSILGKKVQLILEGEETDEDFLPGDPLPNFPFEKLMDLIGTENLMKLVKNAA